MKHESPAAPILPSCIGIFGSGQLGAMMTQAAHHLGIRVVIFDQAEGPAMKLADKRIVAPFQDHTALKAFAGEVDLITTEFENIPFATLAWVAEQKPVFPDPEVVQICQDRILEKQFLSDHGFPVAPWAAVRSREELQAARQMVGGEAFLKTATLGYDGKGQYRLSSRDEEAQLVALWASLESKEALRAKEKENQPVASSTSVPPSGQAGQQERHRSSLSYVLEQKVDFVAEASVIVARNAHGQIACFAPQENRHHAGILDSTLFPASFSAEILAQMEQVGRAVAQQLDLVGLLTVEFFLLSSGEILINELAPRPHNSGHHTIESCRTSQFEQVIRAISGMPLGDPHPLYAAAMVNLLGDLWPSPVTGVGKEPFPEEEGMPPWQKIPQVPPYFLHLYGKTEARPGRKMGHLTLTAPLIDSSGGSSSSHSPKELLSRVLDARALLLHKEGKIQSE